MWVTSSFPDFDGTTYIIRRIVAEVIVRSAEKDNKNEDIRNKIRTDMLVIPLTCFVLLIGAVLVTSGSAATVR